MKRIRVIVALIIIGIALFSSWILKSLDQIPLMRSDTSRHEPDYFLTAFEATVLSKAGSSFYRLAAVEVIHYPDTATLDLERPDLSMLSTPEKWQLRARRGRVWEESQVIELEGEVYISREASRTSPALTIETRELTLNLGEKYAETKTEVKMTQGQDTVQARGMFLDLEDGRVELMSNVHGNYQIPAH